MTVFDTMVFSIFNHYKVKLKRKANTISILYISILQITILLFLGVFFSIFFQQMNVDTMDSSKAWLLFSIASIIIYFKNWIQYSGKKRRVLNAKSTRTKTRHYNVYLLWLLPIGIITISIILLKA
ncbi:MAG: hypothetical protein HKO92_04720 [Flavobacteriaceae bacterium]|nr:hypothetical protein [Flavobacteriaceae bacterium]